MVNLHPTFAPAPGPRRRRSSAGVSHASATMGAASAASVAAVRTRRYSLTRERRTWVDAVLDRPQFFTGIGITVLFLFGTALSLYWESSMTTSQLRAVHNHSLERAAFFARKRNWVNVIFVKRAWAWTSALFLFHLLTTPRRGEINAPSTDAIPGRVNPALHVSTPRKRVTRSLRLANLVLASLAWIMFTSWCFGAGIGDRVIARTGGVCSVPLPPGTEPAHVSGLLDGPDASHGELLHHQGGPDPHAGDILYFPLPAKYCLHVPLNPKTHPLLFSTLEAVHAVHADIHAALRLPPPRWSGGFDISGHAFLLTLAALILAGEVAPSWRRYRARNYTQRPGRKARVHALATVLATALIGLWVWMLFMTAIYFHDPDEKLAGLVLGLVTAAIIHAVRPQPAGPVIEFKVRGPTRRPSPAIHTLGLSGSAAGGLAAAGVHAEPVHPFDEREVERERAAADEAYAHGGSAAAAALFNNYDMRS